MRRNVLRTAYCVLLAFLAGCSSLAPVLSSPTPFPALTATSAPQATPTSTPAETNQPRLLRVWLPPRFDPNTGTPSANLLKQRLQDFEDSHPRTRIDVRIKNESAILGTLSVTNTAAPAAMPDLIALSYSDMQSAASAGFLHPLEGLTNILQDPDWYAVARDFAHVQNTEFGLPFASDVLLIVYRPVIFQEPPSNWEAVFTSGSPIVFPVSDPKALFALALYLSDAGRLADDQGNIAMNEDTLVRLLSFHKRAVETGIVSSSVRDYQTDSQSLQYFHAGQADMAVIWASSDIRSKSGEYMPLMGLNGTPYSLADGWVWALAGSKAENQSLAAELASYLAESEFLGTWTQDLGYVPTRPQALAGWSDEALRTSLNEILQSAHPMPPNEVIAFVGPVMQEALIKVFNGEQPEVAARSVMEQIK